LIELRSHSNRLTNLEQTMLDYVTNGARLGWLIDPYERQVYIYRKDREIKSLFEPLSLSGKDVLPGFVSDLSKIWSML